ncbi:MAG TPA: family 16 glycoside hydrolase [Candidatus Sulfotelmatobacter sp.]
MKPWLCLFLLALSLAASADNSVSQAEAGDGWLLLFDGESLFGWTPQGAGRWVVSGGAVASASDSAYLQSNSAFTDFLLKFDYRSAGSDGECGVFLRTSPDGDPKDTGYQLQVGDTKSDWPTGSIVEHLKAEAVHPALNQWHSVDATLSADHITIKLDGKQVVDGKNARSRAGVITLGCNKAGRVQFRNLKLKPVGMKVLFNGTDLSGWKAVGPPPPKKKGMIKKMIPGGGKAKEAQWSVAGGAIHGQGGEGQLESTAMYDDFVLQLAIRVNSPKKNEHPRTGVFLRGDAGQLFSGYEVPALNEFKDENRSHPLPDSTGGLKGLQSPRKVAASDNQFFMETIATRGRHIEIWIDGYPVTDFQDTRAEGNAPQKDARTSAGTISLQSPDEKANLDFRNIQVAQLPKVLGKGPAEATALQPPPPAVPAVPASSPGQQTMVMPAFPPPDPNKPKVQQLMSQAFTTSDPQQQRDIYEQILKLDPNNVMAANGYQQAQQKIEAANTAKQEQQVQQQQQTQTEAEKVAEAESARQKAETAFLAGDLNTAHTQIGVAEKSLSPDAGHQDLGHAVADLRTRIEAAIQARTRLRMMWGGFGIAALIGLISALWASRGKKDAYLEVIDGVDKGKKFNLDQEVVHMGAVAEDGGHKNEIVVRDLERMISRFHCEIHKRNGKFFLIDLGSANGTRVDGQRVKPGKPMLVKSGARVELGGTCALRLGWKKRSAE